MSLVRNDLYFLKTSWGYAIGQLVPNAKFNITNGDYSSLEWFEDFPPPTEQEILDKIEELKADFENNFEDIRIERSIAYPEVKEQLDALWHDIHNGTLNTTGNFYTLVKEVKDNYPKVDLVEE